VSSENPAFSEVVDSLCATSDGMCRTRGDMPCRHVLPSRDTLISMVEDLRSVLFPGYFGMSEVTRENMSFYVGSILDRVLRDMREQVKRGYCFTCDLATPNCAECEQRALETTRTFMARLPEIRRMLATDVQAAYEGDPAATCPDEAIFCYPGMLAVTNYRLAHELHLLDVPLLPRIITEHAHSITGVDIHPGATIGEKFFIDHATGVVIGETTVIGRSVRIYQGVTLGAKSFPLDRDGKPIKGIPRHPIVEDDVIIYGGATILGRVTIGRGSVIGGNVWLTRSVPPGSRITQARPHEESFEEGSGI
jgi:serine O-acetyltransferase